MRSNGLDMVSLCPSHRLVMGCSLAGHGLTMLWMLAFHGLAMGWAGLAMAICWAELIVVWDGMVIGG